MLESTPALTPRNRSELVVVICAYCGRVRMPMGDWLPAAPYVPPLLVRWSEAMVSHGCCPECFEREMAKCRISATPAEWRARRW
jgi:hypothetical protein